MCGPRSDQFAGNVRKREHQVPRVNVNVHLLQKGTGSGCVVLVCAQRKPNANYCCSTAPSYQFPFYQEARDLLQEAGH